MNFTQKLKTWQTGLTGFNAWLKDIQPRILGRNNRYQPFSPTSKQKKFIKQVLATTRAGRFKHSISLNIEPRRHGKSTVFALIVLWFFTSRQNFTIQLLGSSEDHCRRVQFNTLKKVINASPKLAQLIPEQNQFAYTIQFPELKNQIQYSASNTATAFGDRINLMWVSDLHAFVDMAPFNALQASLLDSEDSLLFIDSNVDDEGAPVHALQKEAESDPDMLCQFTSYKDFAEYEKKAPAWIDRKKAQRLQKTTFEPDFKRDILGQRSDSKNALFSAEVIEQCKAPFKSPVESIEALTQGRAYKVGGGLDRAKSLIPGRRSDSTVWSVVAKVATENGEPEFFLLHQHIFTVNTARNIKAVILADHAKYHLDNCVLENYETGDLFAQLCEEKVPVELVSAHSTNQQIIFPELYRICKEGRFHAPRDLTTLFSEMGTFAYHHRKNGTYSFGHSSEKWHDDTVFSLAWSCFALRKEVLTLFEMSDIICDNRSRHRHHCFLMGGNLELHCKANCPAYQEAEQMWRQYRTFNPDSEITLPDFFYSFVKVSGAVFYQSA